MVLAIDIGNISTTIALFREDGGLLFQSAPLTLWEYFSCIKRSFLL